MLDKLSKEVSKLSTADAITQEMQFAVRSLAQPLTAGESVKSCIRRVSRNTGLTFRQVKRLWYGDWPALPACIYQDVKEKAAAHDRLQQARAEASDNLEMLRSLHARLSTTDPDFYRAEIDALECALAGSSPRNRTGDV